MLKKGLSQHLIKDKNITEKMARFADISNEDVVVEIGAGHGDLTRSLAARAGRVYAIEVDHECIPQLQTLEKLHGNIRVIPGDFLKKSMREFGQKASIKVIGNIPYKITGPIVFKILEERDIIKGAYLTMQAEVARRIVSKPFSRTYGALSVVCQVLSDVRILFSLKPSVFFPPPKVDSVYLSLIPKDDKRGMDGEFMRFIRICFQNKRKHLRYTLSKAFDAESIAHMYEAMKFPPAVRAEEIEPHKFEEMYGFFRTGVEEVR
jgi:16S rRNA (adenine1518-N6/adenine1519-N6)-dimethyltransferase